MTMSTTDVNAEDGDFLALQSVEDPTTVSNREIFGAYLRYVQDERAQNTYESYRTSIRRFHAWLNSHDAHVTETTETHVERFLGDMGDAGYSANTVSTTFDTLRHFYNVLPSKCGLRVSEHNATGEPVMDGLSKSDVAATRGKSMAESETGHERHFVEKEEFDQLVEHAPEPVVRNRLVLNLLWETGWRRSTLTNIEVDNIDHDAREITSYSPKIDSALSERDGTVTAAYSEVVADLLSQYLDLGLRDGYYCADESDKLLLGYRSPLEEQGIGQIVKDAAENAGIQEVLGHDAAGNPRYAITAHTLRHGHAMYLLEETDMTVADVRESLRHHDIEQTQTYLEQAEDRVIEKQKEIGMAARQQS